MRNEYRDAMLAYKRSWLAINYEYLVSLGKVSAPIAKWIDGEGGVSGMKLDQLDSFGDLIARSLVKIRQEQEDRDGLESPRGCGEGVVRNV